MSTTPPLIRPDTYRAILADPPWDLYQKGKYGASRHYDLLDLEFIKRLGKAVDYAAAEKSYLFLWVTTATVPAGIKILEAWGYRYTSYYFWAKPRMTLGNTIRNAGELLLLGTRGKANKFEFRSQPNWGCISGTRP